MWDCSIRLEEAEENWKVTRMGHWDGEASYLPYLLAKPTDLKLLKNGTKTETSDSKTSSRKRKPKSKYWKKFLKIQDKFQF